jgi:hypothetical protein
MINAGVKIASFNGKQSFNSETQLWEGIEVSVNYPGKQTPVDNPIQIGDLLIEPGGNIWQVEAATVLDDVAGVFELSLSMLEEETTDAVSPGLGTVNRGGIVTPKQGYVAPHWDSTIVDANVSRIASMITMENYDKLFGGGDGSDAGDGSTDTGPVWLGVVDGGELGNSGA